MIDFSASALSNYIMNSTVRTGFTKGAKQSSKKFCIMGFVSADDKSVDFRTDGTYGYHVTGRNISAGKEMTDDHKWEAITSEYSG